MGVAHIKGEVIVVRTSAEQGVSPLQNMAHLVSRHARAMPEKLALSIPTRWEGQQVRATQELTYGELWARVEAYQRGLKAAGYKPGDRFVLMFPVSAELYALVLALFASGMVAVLVDTGMGVGKMLEAIEDARAVAFVSVKPVLRLRPLLPALYRLRCYSADDAKLPGIKPLSKLAHAQGPAVALCPVGAESHALITFTSGSTGRPKGANRTHGHLRAQHLALSEHFPERVTDIDCPCFPVVVLHNLCCGMTTVLPAVDLRSPGEVDPALVLTQLRQHQITRLAAAPAFMSKLAAHMLAAGESAPSVRLIFVGGGPVSLELCAQIVGAFPQADSHVVYGSTEAEPITSITMRERLDVGAGEGTLVGHVAHCAEVRLVEVPPKTHRLQDGLKPLVVATGQVGEVVVSGEHVNKAYVDNAKANEENKLIDVARETVWHRTGDTGRWDEQGRLWLVGRLKDVVRHQGQVLHPFGIEEQAERVEGVERAALLSHPYWGVDERARATLVWSPQGDHTSVAACKRIEAQLERLLDARGLIHSERVQLKRVPVVLVDRRHNTKIDRVALRAWLKLWPGMWF